MKSLKLLTVVSVLILTASACSVTKENFGMAAGGVAGGVLGSQIGGGTGRTIAIIGGTVLGAALGGHIGSQLDELDRMKLNSAINSTPTGRTTSWVNPDSGKDYTVTPTRTYNGAKDTPCRDYEMVVDMRGDREVVKGTACLNNAGEWVNK